jgi:hypothetical protein
MSIDDSVIPTTISFEGYEISVNFYPIQSSYFETIRQKFNTDQTHLVDSVIAPSTEFSNSMSLIRIISPGDLSSFTPFTLQQMENTKITCSVDIFSSAIDYNIESINEKNLKVILSSIVTDVHASLVEGDNFKKLNSNLLENGVIGRIGMTYKNALFSVESKHLGTYSYNPKPYAVCSYYTDNNSNITSSSYQYANAARFANCSCPSMISASPIKDSPIPCLWKKQNECMMYSPNSVIIRQDVIHPKADLSLSLHLKLIEENLNDGSSSVKIYSDNNPVIVFDKSSFDFSIDSCITVYEQYINDIASDVVPVSLQVNQNNKSKFLLSLISE